MSNQNSAQVGSAEADDDELQQVNYRISKRLHRQAKRLAALNQVSLAKLSERLLVEEVLRSHQELQEATEREVQEVLEQKKNFESDLAEIAGKSGVAAVTKLKRKKE